MYVYKNKRSPRIRRSFFCTRNATETDASSDRRRNLITNYRKRSAQSLRHARNPARLARRRKPIERKFTGARRQGAKCAVMRRDQPRRGGIKGDPRRDSPATLGASSGPSKTGRAARVSPSPMPIPRCRPYRW